MAKAEIIPQANELCRISKGTRITGVMTSSADIRIDGIFEGTVYTKGKLVIGEAAHVKGKVFCQNCDLGIEVGTIFNGSCHIITKEEYNKFLNETADLKGAHKPSEPAAPQPSKK